MSQGKFIVLDGPDGSGKSTQIALLQKYLQENLKIPVFSIREPGGTKIGEQIRRILLDLENKDLCLESELLLFMASRAQLVKTIIKPALSQGISVLADRFLLSSIVYQGLAGGLGCDTAIEIGNFATKGLVPDLTLILDVPVDIGFKRISHTDLIESRGLEFHQIVRQGFLDFARTYVNTFILDGTQSISKVQEEISKRVSLLFQH